MLAPFIGEFLHHPCALEYSGNTCSHNCSYCFANISNPCKYAKFKETISLLTDYKNRDTLTAQMLQNGEAICISNRSDPFSESNWKQTEVLLQYFAQIPNALYFQTKGGKQEYIDRAIDILKDKKNVVFYISITTINDEISKRIEPNAPLPQTRIELAKSIKAQGWHVEIGINPYCFDWFPLVEIQQMYTYLKSFGINEYFIQDLHFSSLKIKNMADWRKKAMSDIDFKNYTRKGAGDLGQRDNWQLYHFLRDLGANIMAQGQQHYTDYVNVEQKTIVNPFITVYQFNNWVIKNKKIGDVVTFEEFYNVLSKGREKFFEKEIKGIDSYILRHNRNLWKHNERVQSIKTFKELLREYFFNQKLHISPQNNLLYKDLEFVEGKDPKEINTMTENGMKYVGEIKFEKTINN